MKHFSIFLSSIFSLLLFGSVYADTTNQEVESELKRYSFVIETERAGITGVMMMRVDDEKIIGSMVNEFGVSAIDFVYDNERDKVKLVNVVSFLNKWYIRSVLKRDIRLCVRILNDLPYKIEKNYDITITDGKVTVKNERRKLKYSFAPMQTTEEQEYETEG